MINAKTDLACAKYLFKKLRYILDENEYIVYLVFVLVTSIPYILVCSIFIVTLILMQYSCSSNFYFPLFYDVIEMLLGTMQIKSFVFFAHDIINKTAAKSEQKVWCCDIKSSTEFNHIYG